jgi:hypothetical protein
MLGVSLLRTVIFIATLTKNTLDSGDDFVSALPSPFRIIPPLLRWIEIDNVMRPTGKHFAVYLETLPCPVTELFVVHRIAAPMIDAPPPCFVIAHFRGLPETPNDRVERPATMTVPRPEAAYDASRSARTRC